MGTTVTLNTDPLYVDIVEDYTISGVNTVISYTELKTIYINKLITEKTQIVVAVSSMSQQTLDNNDNVIICNARSTEIINILDTANGL